MKTLRSFLFITVLSVAAVGCVLFDENATRDEKGAEVQELAFDAASVGSAITLEVQPQYRPAFEAAYIELDRQLSGNAVITLESLRQVLATLPIKELKGNRAVIAVQGARIVFRKLTRDATEEDIRFYARHAAIGIHDGIGLTLGKPSAEK